MIDDEREPEDLLDDPEAEEEDDTDFEDDPSLAGNAPEDKEKLRGG